MMPELLRNLLALTLVSSASIVIVLAMRQPVRRTASLYGRRAGRVFPRACDAKLATIPGY